MDVSSLYTNANYEEGAESCFKKLEEGKNIFIRSIVIKILVIMILKTNAFRFSNNVDKYLVTNGSNYADLFMENFDLNFLEEYIQETRLSPLV